MNFDEVVLILQGPAVSADQLYNDICKYKSININNIIISSYEYCVDERIKDNFFVIENDNMDKNIYNLSCNKELRNVNIHKNKNISSVNFNYCHDDIIDGLIISTSNEKPASMHTHTFFHMTTTKRGLKLADEKFPNAKYYFKLRADMFILNMDECLNEILNLYKNNDMKINNGIFDSKLVINFHNKMYIPYYICDYLAFGKKNDIKNYYGFKKINPAYKFLTQEFIISSALIYEKFGNIPYIDAINFFHPYTNFYIKWHKKEISSTNCREFFLPNKIDNVYDLITKKIKEYVTKPKENIIQKQKILKKQTQNIQKQKILKKQTQNIQKQKILKRQTQNIQKQKQKILKRQTQNIIEKKKQDKKKRRSKQKLRSPKK